MTNLDSVLKSRDTTLPTKVCLVKAMVFPVVMYGCESWTVKKAEHQKIDAFKLWCWRRLLRVCPLNCTEIQPAHPKGDQSWVFIGRTDAEAETPILWPPHAKSWLIEKDPDAGKDWRQEKKGTREDEMAGWHLTQWTWVWVNSRSWWWTGRPGMLRFMGSQSRTRLSDWTELKESTRKKRKGKSKWIGNISTTESTKLKDKYFKDFLKIGKRLARLSEKRKKSNFFSD